jgi:hypothetical protein
MEGSSLKFRLFHEELERQGAARPYGGAFHGWTYDPVDETGRAAREVLARMRGEVAVVEPGAAPEPAAEVASERQAAPKPARKPRAKSAGPAAPADAKSVTRPKTTTKAQPAAKARAKPKAKPKTQ